jgi:hypothetical protein
MAPAHDQQRGMKNLLTAADFEQVLAFQKNTIEPLSSLLSDKIAQPTKKLVTDRHGGLLLQQGSGPQRDTVSVMERQRINRTLYCLQMVCRLYGPRAQPEGAPGQTVDLGNGNTVLIRVAPPPLGEQGARHGLLGAVPPAIGLLYPHPERKPLACGTTGSRARRPRVAPVPPDGQLPPHLVPPHGAVRHRRGRPLPGA